MNFLHLTVSCDQGFFLPVGVIWGRGGVKGDTLPKRYQIDALSQDLNLEQRDMQSKKRKEKKRRQWEWHSIPRAAAWPQGSRHRTVTMILPLSLWSILDSAQTIASSFLSVLWDPQASMAFHSIVLLALPRVNFYCLQLKNPDHFYSWLLVQLIAFSSTCILSCEAWLCVHVNT